MKVCIYCKQSENNTTFSSKRGEHVIPRFLGRFNLYFGNDTVCQKCNSSLSRAETVFKEGSSAGIHSAVYGIDNSNSSIRIRKDRISWTITSSTGELGVFKDVFPFVRLSDNNSYPKPIIILDHNDSKIKYILFIEKYAAYSKDQNSKNFQDRKKFIGGLIRKFKKLNISLFGDINKGWTVENVASLLKVYGINYNKKSEERFEDVNRGAEWSINYTENGDAETLKTPAKIAFNYFAYCAKKANLENILQNPSFDYIRQYIQFGKLPPPIYKPDFNYNSNSIDKRGLHIVSFQEENNFITSFVSLFSRFNYKIVLAKYPFSVQSNKFGCATAFDPFTGSILNNVYSTPQPIINKNDYSLFSR